VPSIRGARRYRVCTNQDFCNTRNAPKTAGFERWRNGAILRYGAYAAAISGERLFMAWESDVRKAMNMDIDELVVWGVGENDNSVRHKMLTFELQRRATAAQIEAAEAQKAASEYTKKNAFYMLCSVWAILCAAVVSALFSFLTWQYPHH